MRHYIPTQSESWMSWQKTIILNPNEQVMHSWDGNCERHHKTVVAQQGLFTTRYAAVEAKEINSGTLVLTSQRLLWFERRGIFSKTMRASFEIGLTSLKGVTCGGLIAKWVSITDSEGESIFHLQGVGSREIESFRDIILRQVERARAEAASASAAPQVIQKEVITREVVMIPCQYCGGLMLQTATFCSNCGAKRKN
jgi:hypothetical protein